MVVDRCQRVKAENNWKRTKSAAGKMVKMGRLRHFEEHGMQSRRVVWSGSVGVALLSLATASAQVIGIGSGRPARRQPAPTAEQLPASDIIEPDALQLLAGPRPDFASVKQAVPVPAAAEAAASQPWSALVSGATLADEIKLSLPPLRQATETQTAFNSNLATALDRFHIVAVVFGLMAAYDRPNDLRSSWRAAAAGLRDQFARVASHVDRDGGKAYPEARTRAEELAALILGETISAEPDERQFQWSQLCDRAVLMRRLEAADRTLTSGTASEAAFADAPEQLLHEAEIVAAIGELIVREAFTDWDDDTYRGYAATMQREALTLRKAVQQADYETAGRAAKAITQSCSTCHDDYR